LSPVPSVLDGGFFTQPVKMESRMEALLTAIVLWLSTNFLLPANLNHPGIKFVSAKEMIAPLKKKRLQKTDIVASEISSDIVSLYSNESKTIYLMDGWMDR
jgi:hypothetical protein